MTKMISADIERDSPILTIKEKVETNMYKQRLVYHGSPKPIKGRILNISPMYRRGDCSLMGSDYGMGLYLTTDETYAVNNAMSKARESDEPTIYKFAFQHMTGIRKIIFKRINTLWLLYLAYNRKLLSYDEFPKVCNELSLLYKSADYIGGASGDGLTSYFLNHYFFPEPFSQKWTHTYILECIKKLQPPMEFAITTIKGLSCAMRLESHRINNNDNTRAVIFSDNADRLQKGINDAKQILYEKGKMPSGLTFDQMKQVLKKYDFDLLTFLYKDYEGYFKNNKTEDKSYYG